MGESAGITIGERRAGAIYGAFVADALAMPVHWYYDRSALHRDYGWVSDFVAPQHDHPDSIMHRSHFEPLNGRAQILHEFAPLWGQAKVHYHRGLEAGENTLNLQLARLLLRLLRERGTYDANEYLERYRDFMLTSGCHRDVYLEECHRSFFTNFARGRKLRRCGVIDNHIGGLSSVGVLVAGLDFDLPRTRGIVREHVGLTHQDSRLLLAADVMAVILWRVIHGEGLREAIQSVGNDFFSAKKSRRYLGRGDGDIIEREFGQACYIDRAFPASLYLAWKYAEDFSAGLVSNTNAGGDNCHRGAVIGALLGAANGARAIPGKWASGLKVWPELNALVEVGSDSSVTG